MNNSVIIKGNKHGFQIVLNPDLSFPDLQQAVAEKFRQSKGFFDPQRPVAISFEGRELNAGEQNILVETISLHGNLKIAYLIDGAKAVEMEFAKAMGMVEAKEVEAKEVEDQIYQEKPLISEQETEKDGQFYRGTLRSGQSIEVDGSIVILGDINPGAHVVAGGNVVVLGCLKGNVTAGYPSDKTAFVAALMMDPMQIKIGELIARSPDQKTVKLKKKIKKKQAEMEAKIAFVEDDHIFIETITRSLISEFGMIQP